MNPIRRKEFFALIGTIAIAALLFFLLRPVVQASLAVPRMLAAVGLEDYPGLRKVGYAEWTDWLQYAPGYEIMAFSVEGDRFDPPDGWEMSDAPISVEAFEQMYHIDLYVDEITALSGGGNSCVAWHFVDGRDKALDFARRDYYLAYCYRRGDKDALFIYRGHHLWSFLDSE